MGDVRGGGCQGIAISNNVLEKYKKFRRANAPAIYAYVANKSTQSDYKQLRLIVDHWQFNY